MKAYLTILSKSQQACICIEGLFESELNLWEGIIEYCAKDLSNNQMREVYKQLKEQLSKLDKEDMPPIYDEMFENYQKAMKNRKIKIS